MNNDSLNKNNNSFDMPRKLTPNHVVHNQITTHLPFSSPDGRRGSHDEGGGLLRHQRPHRLPQRAGIKLSKLVEFGTRYNVSIIASIGVSLRYCLNFCRSSSCNLCYNGLAAHQKNFGQYLATDLFTDSLDEQEGYDPHRPAAIREMMNLTLDCFTSTTLSDPTKLSMVDSYAPKKRWLNGPKWSGIRQARSSVSRWETGAPLDLLKYVGAKSVGRPDNFVSTVKVARCRWQNLIPSSLSLDCASTSNYIRVTSKFPCNAEPAFSSGQDSRGGAHEENRGGRLHRLGLCRGPFHWHTTQA